MPVSQILHVMVETPTLGIPVCLVDNGFFKALAICYNKVELQNFNTPIMIKSPSILEIVGFVLDVAKILLTL